MGASLLEKENLYFEDYLGMIPIIFWQRWWTNEKFEIIVS